MNIEDLQDDYELKHHLSDIFYNLKQSVKFSIECMLKITKDVNLIKESINNSINYFLEKYDLEIKDNFLLKIDLRDNLDFVLYVIDLDEFCSKVDWI